MPVSFSHPYSHLHMWKQANNTPMQIMWGPSLKRLKEVSRQLVKNWILHTNLYSFWQLGSHRCKSCLPTHSTLNHSYPSFLPLIHIPEGSTKNHKTRSIMKKSQDKWGNKRNFIHHLFNISTDIWDNINKTRTKTIREF